MAIHVERLRAEVEASTGDAIRELTAFKAKAETIIKSLNGRAEVKLDLDTKSARGKIHYLKRLVGDIKIKLDVDESDMASIMGMAHGLTPKVKVEPNTRFFTFELRSQLNRLQSLPDWPSVTVNVNPDVSKFRERLAGLLAGAGNRKNPLGNLLGGRGGIGQIGRATSSLGDFAMGMLKLIPMISLGFVAIQGLISVFAALPAVITGAAASIMALIFALTTLIPLLAALPAMLLGGLLGFGAIALAVKDVVNVLGLQGEAAKGVQIDMTGMRNALEGVENAERNLALAQRNAQDAQSALSEARERAADNLEDLRLAAQQAALSEDAAVDALDDAKKQLAQINDELARLHDEAQGRVNETQRLQDEFTGRTYDVSTVTASDDTDERRNDLLEQQSDAVRAIKQAELDLTRTRLDGKRTREALNEAEAKGVDGSDEVVQAMRAIEDANLAVMDSQRSLRDAHESVADQMKAGSEAVDEYNKALAGLSPPARKFVELIGTLKPFIGELTTAAQEGFFPGITRGIEANLPMLDQWKDSIGRVSTVIGDLVGDIAELFATPMFSGVLETTTKNWETVAPAWVNIADGLLQITDAARPFTELLTGWFVDMSDAFQRWAEEGNSTGSFADDLRMAFENFETLASTLINFADGLWEVVRAAEPLTDAWTGGLRDLSEDFEAFVESDSGAMRMKEFFEDLVPIMENFHGIVGEVIGIAADLTSAMMPAADASSAGFLSVLETLREELEPLGKALEPIITLLADFASAELIDFIRVVGPGLTRVLEKLEPAFDDLFKILGKAGISEKVGEILVAIADAFADGLIELIEDGTIEELARALADLLEALAPASAEAIGILIDFLGDLAPYIVAIADAASQFLEDKGGAGLLLIMGFVAALMIAGPVITIIGGIAAAIGVLGVVGSLVVIIIGGLIAIIGLLWWKWEEITTFMRDTWGNAGTYIEMVTDHMAKWLHDKFFEVKDWIGEQVLLIIGFFVGLSSWFFYNSPFGTLVTVAKAAFSQIKDLWNEHIGGFEIKIPDWVKHTGPIGGLLAGKGFTIPTMHVGGTYRAPTGQFEGLALLRDRERILTPQQAENYDRGFGGGIDIDRLEKVLSDAKKVEVHQNFPQGVDPKQQAAALGWELEKMA